MLNWLASLGGKLASAMAERAAKLAPYRNLRRMPRDEAVNLIQSQCVENTLLGKKCGDIFTNPIVHQWIIDLIGADDVESVRKLLDVGYTPDSVSEYWALIEHPDVAALFVQDVEMCKAFGMHMDGHNPAHWKLITAILKTQGRLRIDEDIVRSFEQWKLEATSWLRNWHGHHQVRPT